MALSTMKVDAFGRELQICREDGKWVVFDIGSEGKKRLARDIVIPQTLPQAEVPGYLADLLHEHATAMHSEVRLIE